MLLFIPVVVKVIQRSLASAKSVLQQIRHHLDILHELRLTKIGRTFQRVFLRLWPEEFFYSCRWVSWFSLQQRRRRPFGERCQHAFPRYSVAFRFVSGLLL